MNKFNQEMLHKTNENEKLKKELSKDKGNINSSISRFSPSPSLT
jgi:hypothetical protein